MKALILPFVIALLAGVGVAGGAAVMTAKSAPAPAAADSTRHAADSSAVRVIDSTGAVEHPAGKPAGADSAVAHDAPVAGKADAVAPGHPGGVPAVPTPASKPAGATVSVAASAGQPAASIAPKGVIGAGVAAPPDGPAPEKRIARVIAAMQPRDAAKVLIQMTDHDISIIISNLSEKQEAAILAALPADRLATVSKMLLKPGQAPK